LRIYLAILFSNNSLIGI